MAGTLGLSTPWAREGISKADREDIEAAIPDGWTLGVSVDKNRSQWVFWTVDPDGTISHQLRVSHSMSERAACFYALRHWGLGPVIVVTDAEGYIVNIIEKPSREHPDAE